MEKTRNPIPWLSGGLAALVALFVVAATLPNTDRAVVNHAFNPPRGFIQPDPPAVCYILAASFMPVLCIFILGRRWIIFEWLSWFVLAFLFLAVLGR